jgi:histone-arginine methyltransferase CARM1
MSEAERSSNMQTNAFLPPVLPEWAAAHSLHYQFLANQQLMLEDHTRTGLYHAGIVGNRRDFEGKVVLDVGAGTGILSLFAAQAGAKKVYAIEGTSAAEFARTLVSHAGLSERVEVIQSRLADVELPSKVDVIISEPWGFFLFHERMIEAFVLARDRFLREGGRVFPASARLWLAPFVDDELYDWRCRKVAFWHNPDFHGVDLTALADVAHRELFEMPTLGDFRPEALVADAASYAFDFLAMPIGALGRIELPFSFVVARDGLVHGIAGWFDVAFSGSERRVILSTSPHEPCTHWAQMRFLFRQPLEVRAGQRVQGRMIMVANRQSSYDVTIESSAETAVPFAEHFFRLQSYYSWQGSE